MPGYHISRISIDRAIRLHYPARIGNDSPVGVVSQNIAVRGPAAAERQAETVHGCVRWLTAGRAAFGLATIFGS